jgi:hypothetical protein
MLALTKYWRWQNVGVNKILGVDKILALTKYLHQQNVGVYKILASKKYWRRQNVGVNKTLALTKSWRRRGRILLLFGLRESTAADFSQTSLKISFFSLMVFSLHVVAKCGVASACSNFMGGLSPLLYRLVVPARHA